VTSFPFVRPARAALALAAMAFIGSCGSGGVGAPPVNDPSRITIQPDTAILYSGMPTTFTISGGTGFYIIGSSNQAVVRADGQVRSPFTVIPANVIVDTQVTLTVRDTGTTPVATAALTVRPGTVSNDITVTPTATQGGGCAPAVCSGGDAIVSATISQGGNPLPARGVRLDVVSGDFRFITSPPGTPEVLAATTTVVSDQAGNVLSRIRVLPNAQNQSAVLQVTDLGTSAFRRAAFTIAQATGSSPGFFTVPSTFTFTGPNNLSCAVGTRADVTIFGGTPPYTIANGGTAFSVSHNVVSTSGGSFYIVANGVCAENIPISVVDAAGRTATISVSSVLGENAVPDLLVSPGTVALSSCQQSASVTVAGGVPNSFTVSNVNGAIVASPNPSARIINIARVPNTTATTPLSIGVASGDKTATITVELSGEALNTRCDGSNLALTPSSVTLASCGPVTVAITGGSPGYTVRSDNSSVTAAPTTVGTSGGTFTVQRTPGSASFTSGNVVVTDSGGITRTLPVTATGTGAGSGTGTCP